MQQCIPNRLYTWAGSCETCENLILEVRIFNLAKEAVQLKDSDWPVQDDLQ